MELKVVKAYSALYSFPAGFAIGRTEADLSPTGRTEAKYPLMIDSAAGAADTAIVLALEIDKSVIPEAAIKPTTDCT